MYVIETVDGTELLTYAGSLAEATRAAVSRLEDDPELGELHVYEIGRGAPAGTHVKTITHGPDANWNSVVVVLDPGEKIKPPDNSWRRRDEDGEAYYLDDTKHPQYHEIVAGQWDNREKV